MGSARWRTVLCLVILLAAAPRGWAQQPWRQPPRIGYAWPAGGQKGQTVEVTVGGQYLKDAGEIRVSGSGVSVELVDYIAPPTQKEINAAREVFTEARKKIQEEAKAAGTRENRPLAVRRLALQMAKEKGITEKELEAFRRYQQQRNDPKYQLNPQISEWLKLRVTAAKDAEPGVRELRVTTRNGLSNPIRFLVGQFPEFRESEPNDKMSAATVVPSLPVVLNGQILPGDVDRFRFHARKGQRLVIDVGARSLIPYLADAVPGWFQATVTLYDAGGRQVAYADDYRFDPDPVLLYAVPDESDYVLEIRDSIYRGRDDFVYRVTVGELPFVTSIFPLGGQRGQTTGVVLNGWNLPAEARAMDLSFDRAGVQPLSVRSPAGTSNAVAFEVGDLPECCEQEKNDDAGGAQKVTLPLVVNGRVDRSGDEDVFRFHAREGDQVVAEVHARRLGSPLDSLLRVTDTSGTELAANDDHADKSEGLITHHADSLLVVTIPKTGDYLVRLSDAQRKGGPAYAYRLRVSHSRPDFELRVVPSVVNARGSSTVPITVYAVRRDGFAGDIQLRLKDAPEQFLISGGCVPAGQEQVRLTLTVPSKPAEKLTPMVLEGVATIGGREICREAVAADDMMQAFAYRHLVPADGWTIAVEPVRWNQPPWKVDSEPPVKLKAGATTVLHVRPPGGRRPAGEIFLELSEPPEGITVEKVTPAGDGFDMVVRADAEKAAPGLKGNLIINVSIERQPPKREGQPPPRVRRTLIGPVPALPFEVVGG